MRFPVDKQTLERRLGEMDARYNHDHAGTVLGMIQRALDTVDADKGTVVYRFTPQPWMTNPGGSMHGGVIATMFDNAMGMTATACGDGGMTPTVEMQVSYLRPVALDRTVYVRVTLRNAGWTLTRLTAELWQEGAADRLSATATGTFVTGRG